MFKKNTAVTGFGIGHFINTTTGAAVTTGTPTCKRTLDGTGGACANAASYNTDGAVWEIDLATTDMNGDMVILSFTLTDCLPIAYTIRTTTGIPDASGYFPADVIAISGDTGAADAVEDVYDDATSVTNFKTILGTAPGANGGLLIAGANAATTFATLTSTGAFTCGSTVLGNVTAGTITQTGATSWGAATFASITCSGAWTNGSTVLGATTATTIGATSITLSGALQAATIVSTGTTTLNALTVTGACTHGSTVLGNTTMGTLTQSGAASLGVGSTVTFATLAVTGAFSVGTTTTLTGNVSCGAAFDVVGALTCNSFATDTTFAVGSALSVGTTTTFTGDVTHSGKTILTGEVRITDVTTANSLGKRLADIQGYVDCLPESWVVPGTGTSTLTTSDIDARLAAIHLDHLFATAASIPSAAAGTFWDQLICDGSATYDRTTESLQALRDRGDAAWITATGFSTVTTANIQTYCDAAITANTLIKRIMPGVAGTVTGAGTGTEVFTYGAVVMTVTVDSSGNRSAVVFS